MLVRRCRSSGRIRDNLPVRRRSHRLAHRVRQLHCFGTVSRPFHRSDPRVSGAACSTRRPNGRGECNGRETAPQLVTTPQLVTAPQRCRNRGCNGCEPVADATVYVGASAGELAGWTAWAFSRNVRLAASVIAVARTCRNAIRTGRAPPRPPARRLKGAARQWSLDACQSSGGGIHSFP